MPCAALADVGCITAPNMFTNAFDSEFTNVFDGKHTTKVSNTFKTNS